MRLHLQASIYLFYFHYFLLEINLKYEIYEILFLIGESEKAILHYNLVMAFGILKSIFKKMFWILNIARNVHIGVLNSEWPMDLLGLQRYFFFLE